MNLNLGNLKPNSEQLKISGVIVIFTLAILAISMLVREDVPQQNRDSFAGREVVTASAEPETPKLPELPFGGRSVLPGYRYVGLYGSPNFPMLGALGQQDAVATIARTKAVAAEYQSYSLEKVIPTLEIIVTVASAGATSDGNYSQELDPAHFDNLIALAKAQGVYVILDLQPGRTDFLAQARQYERLLKEPHVGLALDPEWRIGPDQVHLKQIGSVSAAEVNQVSTWLADLVTANQLPQKVFLIHQFKLKMLPDRAAIDTSRPELGFVIQMDGQGPQGTKLDTWRNIVAEPPANTYFGWKNFYQKDPTLRTPADTMAIEPKPYFVSFQ